MAGIDVLVMMLISSLGRTSGGAMARLMSKSRLELATTDYSNIISDRFMVRYAFHPTITAICGRRAPPHDLVKVVQAIVLASIWPEQFIALAGIQTNRDILEPGSQIALHFRIK